jgi:hypothetical protein
LFQNLVAPYMRVKKRIDRFAENRELLMELRQQKGLKSPFRLPSPFVEETPAQA